MSGESEPSAKEAGTAAPGKLPGSGSHYPSSMVRKLKWAGLIVLGALVVVYFIQNMAASEVRFLTWRMEIPLSLMLLLFLGVGFTAGWTSHWLWRK